jgi:molecular chaperone GrpE (heat shock protein)
MDSAAIESGFARLEADIKRLSAEISTLRSVLQGSDQEAMGRVATSARTPTQSAGAEKAVPSAARIPKAVAPEEAYKQTQAMAVETVRSFEEVRESTRQIREDLARTLAQPSGNVTAASQRLVSELMDTLVNRFGLEPLNPAPGAVLKRQEMVVERTETAALGVPGRVVRTIVPGWRYQGVVIDKARVIATPLVEG